MLDMTISENNEERIAFRTKFYSVMKRVIQQLQASQKHLIVVGDFNTICGLYDSAYMKYDVESNGFVETFRSMSDWLESLLFPESLFHLFPFMVEKRDVAWWTFSAISTPMRLMHTPASTPRLEAEPTTLERELTTSSAILG